MFSIIIRTLIIILCLHGHRADAQKKGNITVRMNHFAAAEKLVAGGLYKNSYGETYTIDRLKYYISGIKLISTDGNAVMESGDPCYLVYSDDELSGTITFEVSEGRYSAISFLLGVDSLYNVSGAQTGALDPVNGMFWTWNTGYVSIKIEGRSPLSNLPQHLIEYHLGGFKGPDNVNQRIDLLFPGGNTDTKENKTTMIRVKTDVNSFFNSVHSLPIKNNPACTSPGRLARQYSENYARIFSIDKVEYK